MALPITDTKILEACTATKLTFERKGDAQSLMKTSVANGPSFFDFVLQGRLRERFEGTNTIREAGSAYTLQNNSGKMLRKAIDRNTVMIELTPSPLFLPFQREIRMMQPDEATVLEMANPSFIYIAAGSVTFQDENSTYVLPANTAKAIPPSVRVTLSTKVPTVYAYVWRA